MQRDVESKLSSVIKKLADLKHTERARQLSQVCLFVCFVCFELEKFQLNAERKTMHVVLVCVTSRSDFSRKHVPFLFSKLGTNFSQLFHTLLYTCYIKTGWLSCFFLDHSYSVIRDSVVFSIELMMQML